MFIRFLLIQREKRLMILNRFFPIKNTERLARVHFHHTSRSLSCDQSNVKVAEFTQIYAAFILFFFLLPFPIYRLETQFSSSWEHGSVLLFYTPLKRTFQRMIFSCFEFSANPPVSGNEGVCMFGLPLLVSSSSGITEACCGRCYGRVDCPSGYTCVISPIDAFAVCCRNFSEW